MNKIEILTQAVSAREQEVVGYQINIDNYTLAIDHIDSMASDDRAELQEFREQLRVLLQSEILEQKKANVMLFVIKQQVAIGT